MNRWIAGLLCSLLAVLASGVRPAVAQMLMNGAGATFPYPIYSKWFDEYTKVRVPASTISPSVVAAGSGRSPHAPWTSARPTAR